jgi:guanylate kinase
MDVEFRNPTIYIISGKAKHGKDTFSAYLKDVYERHGKKVIITQLAKYIKYYAREMTGWDLSEETKPREFLQQLGTGVIRQKLKKDDLFIKRMIDDIEIFSYFYDVIIISDVRLKKEIYDLKKAYPNIKVIHIVRPDFDNGLTEEQKNHPTEKDLDDFNEFDIEVVNTTLEELEKSVKKIYTENER